MPPKARAELFTKAIRKSMPSLAKPKSPLKTTSETVVKKAATKEETKQ